MKKVQRHYYELHRPQNSFLALKPTFTAKRSEALWASHSYVLVSMDKQTESAKKVSVNSTYSTWAFFSLFLHRSRAKNIMSLVSLKIFPLSNVLMSWPQSWALLAHWMFTKRSVQMHFLRLSYNSLLSLSKFLPCRVHLSGSVGTLLSMPKKTSSFVSFPIRQMDVEVGRVSRAHDPAKAQTAEKAPDKNVPKVH